MLRASDGLEGFVNDEAYLAISATSDIHRLNEAAAVHDFLPGVLIFGTNGGGTGYGIEWLDTGTRYVEFPLVGMDRSEVTPLGVSFAEFLDRI